MGFEHLTPPKQCKEIQKLKLQLKQFKFNGSDIYYNWSLEPPNIAEPYKMDQGIQNKWTET